MLADKTMPHPHIKIIDFGLAHRLKQGEEYRSLSGTPQYIGKWNIPRVYSLCLVEIVSVSMCEHFVSV